VRVPLLVRSSSPRWVRWTLTPTCGPLDSGTLTLPRSALGFSAREVTDEHVPGRSHQLRSAAADVSVTVSGRVNDWSLHLSSALAAIVTLTS
jgi:hypothetical protein